MRVWFLLALAAGAFGSPAWACPDYRLNGQVVSLTSDQLYSPVTFERPAGGEVDIGPCPVPGQGYVTRAPDFTIRYDRSGRNRDLEFRVDSACDSILLVNLPDGSWRFDDDSNGNMDARIRIGKAPDGTYDVWLGRLGSKEPCRASLTIETF